VEVHRSHIIKCCQSVLVVGRHRFEARIAERNSETTRSGGVVPLRHPALYQPSPQSIFAPTLLSLPTPHPTYPLLSPHTPLCSLCLSPVSYVPPYPASSHTPPFCLPTSLHSLTLHMPPYGSLDGICVDSRIFI